MAGVTFLVAAVVATGFRLRWWGALTTDVPSAPWEWFERLSWIAGIAGLLVSMRSARRSSDGPSRSPRKLAVLSAVRPKDIGVHPAARPQNSTEGALTPYVDRDTDVLLRSALSRACSRGGLIAMVGDSATGKSRSLYEALAAAKRKLSGWRIFIPHDADELRAASAWLPARTLIVLDDTPSPRFLAPGGVTAADVKALIRERRGPVVVICVLWPSVYDAITATPTDGKVLIDQLRHPRDVLGLAEEPPVLILSALSAKERECAAARAAESGDRRLLSAVADQCFGMTQSIAGVPQLADHLADAAGKHPAGAALLTSVIDIRRLGIRQPLTKELLRAVFPAYLDARTRHEAPRQSFSDAFAYARRQLVGQVRALNKVAGTRPGGPAGYELHDYLQQAGALDRHQVPVPPAALDVLAARITDTGELTRLALAADRLGHTPQAKALLQRVWSHHETARWRLVQLLVDERDEAQLRQYLAEGLDEARVGLVEILADQQRLKEVMTHWGHPDVDDQHWWALGEDLFGRGHEQLFRQLEAAGDENGHMLYLKLLEKHGGEDELAALAPPLDPKGDGWAQTYLARLYVRQGRIEEAIEEYEDLMQREDGDFAAEATGAWAALMVDEEREDDLRDWMAEYPEDDLPRMYLADLLAGQQRLTELRELAGYSFTAKFRYTALLRRMGRVDDLRELVTTGGYCDAEETLAALLEDLHSENDLRQLAADGSGAGRRHLNRLLATLGRTEELRSRALSGDDDARNVMETPPRGPGAACFGAPFVF